MPQLPYTMGTTVKSNNVFTNEYSFQEFTDKFRLPRQIPTTRSSYKMFDKARRGKIKATNRYVMPGYVPKGVRNRAGVTAITMLCIDLDVPEYAEIAAENLKKCKYNHWAYPTLSSGIDDDGLRLRVFVETDGTIQPKDYEAAVLSFLDSVGMKADQVDKASFMYWQAMFLPLAFKDDDTEGWLTISEEHKGEIFSTSDVEERFFGEVVAEFDEDAEAFGDDDYLQRFAEMPAPAKEGELLKALTAIPADVGRETWIKVGKAIFHQYGGTKEGLDIWDDWSEEGRNYAGRKDLEKDWKSFKSSSKRGDRPITIGSIFYIAKEYGWVQSNVIEVDFSRTEETVTRLCTMPDNSEFLARAVEVVAKCGKAITASIMTEEILTECKTRGLGVGKAAFNRDVKTAKNAMIRARVEETGGIEGDLPLKRAMKGLRESHRCVSKSDPLLYYSINEGTYLPDNQFIASHLDEIRSAMIKAGYDVDVGVKEKCKDAAMKMIPKVDAMDFCPNEDVLFESGGQTFVNTYNPATVPAPIEAVKPAEAAAMERLMKHFELLISRVRDRDILIDFLANLVQNPADKCSWAILLQGGKGIGKSYIGELMRMALGGPESHKYTTVLSDSSKFEGRFNSWAEGVQLVVVNEMRLKNVSQSAIDSVKTLITDTSISIERKRQDVRVVKNTASYIFFTNDHDAIRIEMGDRRFCVIFSDIQRREQVPDKSYFDALWSDLEKHPKALVKFFHDWEISAAFDPKGYAPFTTSKAIMMETGANYKDRARMAIHKVVTRMIEDKPKGAVPYVYSAVILHWLEAEYYEELELARKSVQAITRDITTILAELGYFRVGITERNENRIYYSKEGIKRFSAIYSSDIHKFEEGIAMGSDEYYDVMEQYRADYAEVDDAALSGGDDSFEEFVKGEDV